MDETAQCETAITDWHSRLLSASIHWTSLSLAMSPMTTPPYGDVSLTRDRVLLSCVMVLLKLMYLKSLIQAKNTHMATAELNCVW